MNIRTRALRHEVHHVPSPEGLDFERDGMTFEVRGGGEIGYLAEGMVDLLATMRSPDGRVAIEGFYDRVKSANVRVPCVYRLVTKDADSSGASSGVNAAVSSVNATTPTCPH
jgi:hypothetical protein